MSRGCKAWCNSPRYFAKRLNSRQNWNTIVLLRQSPTIPLHNSKVRVIKLDNLGKFSKICFIRLKKKKKYGIEIYEIYTDFTEERN